MANDFSSDADCKALWKFESGALATDSKGGNTLTLVNTPTEDAVNYKEGSCAISLAAASSQYAKIINAALDTGFPFKSGDAIKLLGVSCWVRPTTVDTNKRRIWSKWYNTGNQRGIELYHNSTQIYFQYSNNGTATAEVSLAFGAMTINQWYHITLIVDAVTLIWRCLIYNDTAGTWYTFSGTITTGVYASTAEWRIGADQDLGANLYFDGQIDELVVFADWLHNAEVAAIRGGSFPVTGVNIYDWLIDPVNGTDAAKDGFSDWAAQEWKTLKHAFLARDIIYVSKNVETVQAGTGTVGAYPAATITTTDDLTGSLAVYDIIRLTSGGVLDNAGNDLYMIKAITSSVITLYRPYRGTAESGKSIYKLTPATGASNDWVPTSGNGTSGNPITINAGINTATNVQDGFTIINGPGSGYGWGGTSARSYWTFLRLGFINFQYNWNYSSTYNFDNLIFTNCFAFKNFGNVPSWTNVIVNGFVVEQGSLVFSRQSNCIINDLETADSNSNGLTFQQSSGAFYLGNIYNRWKNAGYAGKYAWYSQNPLTWGPVANIRFNDCVLDELGAGMTQINLSYLQGYFSIYFSNPTIGAGTLFNTPGYWVGEIHFQNVNGSATDNRIYGGIYESGKYALISRDDSVYHTAAPSVKVALYQSAYPYFVRHYIPCEAGVQKTISVWFRKNTSYGASTRPTMRLWWMTGTTPNLVTNMHDEVMADTNDTWLQYSYAVTPSVQGSIIMELIFQSANAGAIAWYDDIGVA